MPEILEPGTQLGKYKIVAHIATGGMGTVYKAEDESAGITVALKVLAPSHAANERALERFRREARHAANLSHPNIVTLLEFGHDDEREIHFLAMEFVEGIDLATHIQNRKQLDPEETRQILIQATRALIHACDNGVIHRDIKPSNFLLSGAGASLVVKLADLGLAVMVKDGEYALTREGCTVGTVDYMAPEQARDSRAADSRSDMYSLGCTAYHMLAGRPPFAEGGLGERLVKHMETPPLDVRQFNPAVTAEFWGVLRKMLAKDPAERHDNPNMLLRDLKRQGPAPAPATEASATPKPRSKRKSSSTSRRPTEIDNSTPPEVMVPDLPPAEIETLRAQALHERAAQVLREGGGNDYARQLLISCVQLDPFNLTYRQALREAGRQLAPSKMGRWLGSLNALAIKSKMRLARSGGNWRKVLEHGEDVLAVQPGDADTHLEMATAATQLEQPDLAIWLLEEGCAQVPDEPKLMRALAAVHEERRNWKPALLLWKRIATLLPLDGEARRKVNDLTAQDMMNTIKGQKSESKGQKSTDS